MEHNTSAITVSVISEQKTVTPPHPDDVTFKVAYGKDYKGVKIMPEGEETVMNKDLAADFESRGIGHIVKADEEAEASKDEVKADKKSKK
jgi:hypothetical protein